jgi:2-keto-4-pentenoate hydratase/2-oxohepta-3-ene-1,7-dioic acid hydratase in catechol pathway
MELEMRFASIVVKDTPRWGVIDGEEIALIDQWPTLIDAIAADALSTITADDARDRVSIADAAWLPVIPTPGKILCVGLNYENHRKETGRAIVDNPTIFTRFSDSQTGHYAPIVVPPESDQLDYEGELAVVIGRAGRRIPAADALDYIAGYSCYNDGSIRDWQAHTIQFTPGKNWPDTGAFGPWLVTPGEFGALGPQRIQTRLNGELMQSAPLADMIFPVPKLIEYISTFTPLNPGDVIVSGTPGGVGVKRDPQVFMKPGDTVEVEIDGIGTLVNTIERRA